MRKQHHFIISLVGGAVILGACQTVKDGAHVATYPIRAVDTAIRSEPVDDLTTTTPATHVETAAKAQNLGDAAMTPLSDVNIRRPEIPAVLSDMASPYTPLPATDCETLEIALDELNAVLGPDMDTAEARKDEDKLLSKTTSISVLESAAGSLIPFRSLVRLASGASARDKRIRHYYRKGVARRGYLRGVYATQACQTPTIEAHLNEQVFGPAIPSPSLKPSPAGSDAPTNQAKPHSRP